ncbi:hypothetical protein [Myroides odoratus]|uniref:hypothetical protein n=1 Tax=Myroides odoratus TaxID=256 RepID=UPI0039AEDEA8
MDWVYFFNPIIHTNNSQFGLFKNIVDLCRVKIATLILSLFMFFKPVLPVVEYVVLYDYIKNELCVNRDKPEMQCNGKCHLMKELAHASDTSTEKDKIHFASAEIQISYYQAISIVSYGNLFQTYKTQKDVSVDDLYTFSFLNFLFKPPTYK